MAILLALLDVACHENRCTHGKVLIMCYSTAAAQSIKSMVDFPDSRSEGIKAMKSSFLSTVLKLTVEQIETLCERVIFLGTDDSCVSANMQDVTSPYSGSRDAVAFKRLGLFSQPHRL